MSLAFDQADFNRRSWPHYSSYWGKCVHCGHDFGGPKREPSCFLCHNELAEETIRRQQERDASWAEAKAMFEDQDP